MIEILTEDPTPPKAHKNPCYPQVKREYPDWYLSSWGGAVHLHCRRVGHDRPLTAIELREAATILLQGANELDGATKEESR